MLGYVGKMKSTKIEVEMRVTIILEMLSRRMTRRKILLHIHENFKDWHVGPKTIDYYISKAHQVMMRRIDKDRDLILAEHMNDLNEIYKQSLDDGKLQIALAVKKEVAKMYNLEPQIEGRQKMKMIKEEGDDKHEIPSEIQQAIDTVVEAKKRHRGADMYDLKSELHKNAFEQRDKHRDQDTVIPDTTHTIRNRPSEAKNLVDKSVEHNPKRIGLVKPGENGND